MQCGRVWLAAVISITLAAGCAGHYNKALRDIAAAPEQRLASRVASMEDSARRALKAVEDAADGMRAGAQAGSPKTRARQARFVNDADAAVFEYSRQVLIVADASPASGGTALPEMESLRASMAAAEHSLTIVVHWLRDSDETGSSEIRSGLLSDPGDSSEPLEQARADVAAVVRDAGVVATALGRAGN